MDSTVPPAIQSLTDAARMLSELAARLDNAKAMDVAEAAARDIENASPIVEVTTADLIGYTAAGPPGSVGSPLIADLIEPTTPEEARQALARLPSIDPAESIPSISIDLNPTSDTPRTVQPDGSSLPKHVASRLGSWVDKEIRKLNDPKDPK